MVRGETSRSPMERREAQRPCGRPRNPAAAAARAPGSGPRKPALVNGARNARSQGRA